MAESGEPVRVDWATMRISASCTERALGSLVSGSVAARCSAIARLRRLARIGAACATAPVMRVALGRLDAAVLDHEQGADDLAADELGHAERAAVDAIAQLAGLQRRAAGLALVGVPAADRQARARRRVEQCVREPWHRRRVGRGGQRVAAGVAREHDRIGSRARAARPAGAAAPWPRASSSAPCRASTYSRRSLLRARSRRAWRSSASSPSESTVALNTITKPKATQRARCSSALRALLDVLAQRAVLRAEVVHQRLARAGVVEADRPRPPAVDLVDRRPRVGLPPARRRGEVAEQARGHRLAAGPGSSFAQRALEARSARSHRARGSSSRR